MRKIEHKRIENEIEITFESANGDEISIVIDFINQVYIKTENDELLCAENEIYWVLKDFMGKHL